MLTPGLRRRTGIALTVALASVPAFAQRDPMGALLTYSDSFEARASGNDWCGTTARVILSGSVADLDRAKAPVQAFVEKLGPALAEECPQAAAATVAATTDGQLVWTETVTRAKGWQLSTTTATRATEAQRRAIPPSLVRAVNGDWSGSYCGGEGQTSYTFNLSATGGTASERYCRVACGAASYEFEANAGQPRAFQLVTSTYSIGFRLSPDGKQLTGSYVGHASCRDVQLRRDE